MTNMYSGYYQSCFFIVNLTCWGSNTHGESNIPAFLASSYVLFASVGRHFICILYDPGANGGTRSAEESGWLHCWGSNEAGQLAVTKKFQRCNVEMVRAGDFHTCAKGRVELECWGRNDHGQLQVPDGFHLDVNDFSARNLSTCVISDYSLICFGKLDYKYENNDRKIIGYPMLALGYAHVCHWMDITSCYGDNDLNQIEYPKYPHEAIALSSYGNHTCVVLFEDKSKMTSVCWGDNDSGQINLEGLEHDYYNSISTGEKFSCFHKGKFYIKCVGTDLYHLTTVPDNLNNFVYSIKAGGKFTCMMKGGKIVCYGKNQEKLNKIPDRFIYESEEISSGFNHICSTRYEIGVGYLWRCWGLKKKDQKMIEPPDILHNYNDSRIGVVMASGYKFTCTTLSLIDSPHHKLILCWGANEHDQSSGIPTMFKPPNGPYNVSAGMAHACALTGDNNLACWGLNDRGQTTVPSHMLHNISIVTCGYYHTCALSYVQQSECWGHNAQGQTDIPTSLRYTMNKMVAGGEFSCGLHTNFRRISCWGGNARMLRTPGGLATITSKIFMTAGQAHVCVAIEDKMSKCWGDDEYGQSSSV